MVQIDSVSGALSSTCFFVCLDIYVILLEQLKPKILFGFCFSLSSLLGCSAHSAFLSSCFHSVSKILFLLFVFVIRTKNLFFFFFFTVLAFLVDRIGERSILRLCVEWSEEVLLLSYSVSCFFLLPCSFLLVICFRDFSGLLKHLLGFTAS